jgi:hypothetical protein
MTPTAVLPPDPNPHTRWKSLTGRAASHTRSPRRGASLALLALLVLGPACEPGHPAPEHGAPGNPATGTGTPGEPGAALPSQPLDPAAVSRVEDLRGVFTPISPTSTSDKLREWRDAKRMLLEELQRGPATLAPAALRAFAAEPTAADEWRVALLTVAASTDRELTRPLLEQLSLTYDGQSTLGVRNEAVRLLALSSPASAVRLFGPVVLDPRPNVTFPPKEQMLRHWTSAARAIRQPVDETLGRIATDLEQLPDTRYVAVEELGRERDSTRGRRALETVLVESGSDGLLRRKAAQALRDSLPRPELCALLERVGSRETDDAFALFLADMLSKNCP